MKAPTSNQPQVDPTLKIYGSKVLPTLKVRLKDSDGDRVMIISKKDFDAEKFLHVD